VASELRIVRIPGLPEVSAGANLGALIADAFAAARLEAAAGDVFVVAQKIVSKAEGAIVALAEVTPSPMALAWAAEHGRDAAVIEVVLRESRRIVRMDRGVIISETRHGFICANAGVDASNVPQGYVTLLPRDCDASAARLRSDLEQRLGVPLAVIVSDTFGRPWREGVVNVAIGVSGLSPLHDFRGQHDRFGRQLQSTIVAVADELAGAAELVMGKIDGCPVVVVRGAAEWRGGGSGADLRRHPSTDLFR
jgi:coenzyme F420-0:L-glutamate ligase/coenzyme F420-1:gamma-L-glutamate ligase